MQRAPRSLQPAGRLARPAHGAPIPGLPCLPPLHSRRRPRRQPAVAAVPSSSKNARRSPSPPAHPPPPFDFPVLPGQALVDGRSQAEIRDALAARAVALANAAGPAGRVVILVAGGPGSGKSTFAAGVAARVSAALAPGPGAPPHGGGAGPRAPSAVVLPMDGFHYTRADLDAFPDPAAAHARRGAPWTFDAAAFVDAVRAAARPGAALDAPSFDHGAGDPAPGGVRVRPWHRVVLVEGNYVLLDEEPWRSLSPLAAERWFLGCPLEVAMARVFARQRRQGRSREVVATRIAENDRPNAEAVNASAGRADVIARSDLPARGGSGGSGGGGGKGGKGSSPPPPPPPLPPPLPSSS